MVYRLVLNNRCIWVKFCKTGVIRTIYIIRLYIIYIMYVQNAAAHLITLSRKHEHITPMLYNLHWLPINYLIIFEILLITYKALNNLAPSYIRDLLTPYTPSCQLRSSSKNLLFIPPFNLKTYGARSFSVAAPTLWNALPSDIRNSSLVLVFKNKLKTFLFRKAFQ